MSDETSETVEQSGEPSKITFHQLKSNFFRVIHADGVWGGVTPHLKIQMVFYSERAPIPQVITQEIIKGKLGKEIDKLVKDGIVRELETEVIMDLDIAKAFIVWLDEKIKTIEEVQKKKEAKEVKDELQG